jgi:hypothetical protein
MAELVNGYITVRTGLVEAGAAPSRRVPRSRRASDAELRDRVNRLRRDGWSYRRIAATLELRYTLVAEILDGPSVWVGDYQEAPVATLVVNAAPPTESASLVPTEAAKLSQAVPRATVAPVTVTDLAAVETVLHQQARLSDKVDALLRASEQQRSQISRLETSLLGSIRTENARLAERIMGGLKALLERLLPMAPRRADPPAGE